MDKIKTVQPYKLYKKIFQDKSKAKVAVISAAIALLVMCILDAEVAIPIVLVLVLLGIPIMIYNPMLKKEYEPGKSYSWVKNAVSGKPTFLIKWLPIIGWIGGIIVDITALMFPICTLILGGVFTLLAYLIKKKPEKLAMMDKWLDKETHLRWENHQNVDYNVKVDLNAIYGVNDKLVISYQNFNYEKEKMEDGDYLLGVSAQGVYYVCKNQTITKTKINFGDIDTLGLLAGIGNVYVFHIISKQNDEINIIVNENDSLLVSPIMLFNTLLELLDDFILNGGAVSNVSSRRRRVSVSPGANTETGSTVTESQEMSNRRVVDITYSAGVLEEMRTAAYVGSNRQIEIDTPASNGVVNEESFLSRSVDLEGSEATSNRNIDLDDLISSRIADTCRDFTTEVQTPFVQPSQAKSETPQTETPKEETPGVEVPRKEETRVESPRTKAPEPQTPKVEVSKETIQSAEIPITEQPKKKEKTPIIIGIVVGVVVVALVAVLLLMKGKKKNQKQQEASVEQQLSEQRAEYEQKLADQRAEYEQQLEEMENEHSAVRESKVYSNACDGFINIRQSPSSNAPILGVLKNGPDGAFLISREGAWTKVNYHGIEGYVASQYIQDNPTEVFEYWGMLRKDASNYRFTETDLSPLTARELTYLRNSVYAKHGYVFISQELNNYFKQFTWYRPDPNVTAAVLNDTEKANAEFIKRYQEQNGKTYKPQ